MKTKNTLKAFAGMALILFVVLALINCSSPSNGTTSTGTGPGPNPGLSKLSVTINRNDSNTSKFVFRTTHPTNTDSYSASGVSGISLVDKQDSPARVEVTATGLTTSPTALTVTAKDSSVPEDTSLATIVPGMVKYPTATQDVDGLTDWFNFLDKTLDAYAIVDYFNYSDHGIFHSTIKSLIPVIDATIASMFYGSADEVKANAAMTTILGNWNAIYAQLSGASKDTVDQTLPRIWFNEVANPSNGATFNTVMLNWFKAQGYDVVSCN